MLIPGPTWRLTTQSNCEGSLNLAPDDQLVGRTLYNWSASIEKVLFFCNHLPQLLVAEKRSSVILTLTEGRNVKRFMRLELAIPGAKCGVMLSVWHCTGVLMSFLGKKTPRSDTLDAQVFCKKLYGKTQWYCFCKMVEQFLQKMT